MSKIHIVFGRQGAGKSTYSKNLAKETGGVHFSIDDWMWSLFGLDLPKSMNLKWIKERVERCENQIWKSTAQICSVGREMVLDLGFTKLSKRQMFIALAEDNGFAYQIHYLKAPHALRKVRVMKRNEEKGETFSFEITSRMFDFMEGEFDDPREKELAGSVIVDTNE